MYYCRIKHSGLLKNRFTYFQIGLIFSISLVFFAFNIESERVEYKPLIDDGIPITEITPDVIRTSDLPKKVPPPPKPKQKIIMPVEELPAETVTQEVVKPEPLVEYVSAKVVPKKVEAPKVVKPKPVVKPTIIELPPEPVIDDTEYISVSEMPMFPGCEEDNYDLRRKCAEEKMLKYIYKNIDYPSIAKEIGLEGLTVIQFVVDKDGSIKKVKALKELGGGCSKEAIRVIKGMPTWSPGKQKGRAVKVRFNIPVSFKLK